MLFERRDPTQLAQELDSINNSFDNSDKKEWNCSIDNAGNGTAVIRFLPGKGNSMSFTKLINHGWSFDGRKYHIENCTSTNGDFASCPVCEYIKKEDLFKSNNPLYQKMKRKHSFWANILVIKDPANPENEGKVLKYRFGTKIMDKINAMVKVNTDLGEVPVDVSCAFEGANFLIKIKEVSGFNNYDDSKFMAQGPIAKINDPEFQKFLFDEMADLSELTAESNFLKYDEHKKAFDEFMGGGSVAKASAEIDDFEKEMEKFNTEQSAAPVQEPKVETDVEIKPTETTDSDELQAMIDGL